MTAISLGDSQMYSFRPPATAATWMGRLLAATMAASAMTYVAWAQQADTSRPPIPTDLQTAMSKADAGDPSALTALADSGRTDAQFYAGVLYLRGRGGVARDPARGCAYEEKASATHAEAMHLVGECRRLGLAGAPDPAGAKQAFARAAEMGYPKSRCALGKMLMAEPAEAARGLALCKQAAGEGDLDAVSVVGEAYFFGRGAPKDRVEARRWYEKAAAAKQPQAMRKLGEMYASGDGGKRDPAKALELWQAAEKAGDPLACILVADQLFSDMTGGRKPEPGTFAFKGGVDVEKVEAVQAWYQEALQRDPRPDVQQRAKYAIAVLDAFKQKAVASR